MPTRFPATVTVLAYNSAASLEACLRSVQGFAEILVLDGGSTDATCDIAKRFGARVEKQSETVGPIADFTAVRERSFSLASHDWVFWLDSDEWIDEVLLASIREAVARNDRCVAFRAQRFPLIDGRVMRHGYALPDRVVRLVHRESATWASGKKVHEHLRVHPGVSIEELAGGVYTPWATPAAYRKKDAYYLSLQFAKKLDRRPKLSVTVRSVMKNFGYAAAILALGFYYPLRYWRNHDALPFVYHRRFARYHALLAWQRLRQFFLATRYVPPSP